MHSRATDGFPTIPKTGKSAEATSLSRRQLIAILAGASVSAMFPLVGCAGRGGGSVTLTTLTGTVDLTPGPTLGKLSTANVYATGTVSSTMAFTQAVVGPNPSLVYLQDSSARVIHVAFLDPSSTSNTIGPLSTATALLFFALDGYCLPPENLQIVLNLIANDPATNTLAQTIEQRVTANPYAVDSADSQIATALLSAYNTILAEGKAADRAKLAGLDHVADQSGQIFINGTNPQSGFSVTQNDASTGITGQNQFRRYCRMYVYETGTVDSNGNQTNLPLAKRVAGPIDVDSTQRLNIGTSLQAIFNSTSPLSPISSDLIPLNVLSNTSQTLYDIVVIGSSASPVAPAVFSEAIYAQEISTWKSDLATLNLKSCFADVLFGLFLNFLGVTSLSALPAGTIDQAIANLTTNLTTVSFKQAVAEAALAANPELIVGSVGSIIVKNGVATYVVDRVYIYGVANFLATAAGKAALNTAKTGVLLSAGFRVILGLISGATIVLGVGDLAAVLHDLTASDQADIWNATVTLPTVKLTPTTATFVPGVSSPVEFTAAPPAGVSGTFIWTWTLTGGHGAQLTDEAGHQGTTLTQIKAASVYLLTTTLDTSPITITVEGFEGGVSLGKASAVATPGSATKVVGDALNTTTYTFAPDGTGVGTVVMFSAFTPLTNAINYQYSANYYGPTITYTPGTSPALTTINTGAVWNPASSTALYDLGNGQWAFVIATALYGGSNPSALADTLALQQEIAQGQIFTGYLSVTVPA